MLPITNPSPHSGSESKLPFPKGANSPTNVPSHQKGTELSQDHYAPLQPPSFKEHGSAGGAEVPQMSLSTPKHSDFTSLQVTDQTETPPENSFMSPMIALDAYGVPSFPMPQELRKGPPSFFGGDKSAAGPAVFPSKLAQDDEAGVEASEPHVHFASSCIHNERKVMNVVGLGFGCLLSPAAVAPSPPPVIRQSPVRCQLCGAYANLYCSVVPSSGEWRCPFCGQGNFSEGEYMIALDEDFQEWPELHCRVVDYVSLGQRRASSAAEAAMPAPTVLVLDETLEEEQMHDLQASLLEVLKSLPSSTRLGIISYSSSVAVYDLTVPGVAAADVVPGSTPLSSESVEALLYGPGNYLAPVHACLPIAQGIVAAMRPYRGHLSEAERPRCLGVAVEAALALVRGPASELPRHSMKRTGGSSRIVVCAGGAITVGPGSVPPTPPGQPLGPEVEQAAHQMSRLGAVAHRAETTVDILCGGAGAGNAGPVHMAVLHALASTSGGLLLAREGFGGTFVNDVAGAIGRQLGYRASLEVRTSACLSISRVIGPASPATRGSPAGQTPGIPSMSGDLEWFQEDSALRLELNGVEAGQGLALVAELAEDVPQQHVYMQFATRFTDLHQTEVVRVVTARLPTTGSISTYLGSVKEDVSAVLIGKRSILLAASPPEAAMQRQMAGERARSIAATLGRKAPQGRLLKFPNQLPRLAEALLHLQRSPLLGAMSTHEDERALLRGLFLKADFQLALRMLVPRLLLYREGCPVQEVPPYDLALQSDVALVLDHGTDVFTWLGAELAEKEERCRLAQRACAELVAGLVAGRFPMPRMITFREGSSEARFLLARLIPAHKDPPLEQEARYPQLREVPPHRRAQLKAKLLPTDEPSLCEWMRSLKLAPPDPC